MVKVKICGITSYQDARGAVEAGADAIGFLFYKESVRFISPQRANEIISRISKDVLKVGVFVNEKESSIRWALDMCKFDMLQFHGDETPEFCRKFGDVKVIKAFRIDRMRDLRNALHYDTYAYLFDTYVKGTLGGTGEKFDWELVRQVDLGDKIIFLSGGLTAVNVSKAIRVVSPDWVDVSSSVESIRGKKDLKKVKAFIEAVKNRPALRPKEGSAL
jgi:phosphoribosylanthranilate isomerase